MLVTRGGLGLAHPEVPSPQSPFPGLGHPPWSVLSLMGLLGCRQVQPVSRKSLRGPAHLSSHLGTISFPRCRGCCSMGQPCLCFRPVRSMCLPAGRSPFLSSRLCCWLLLAAARDTVLILCRFALILFRSGRLLCLRQNTYAAKVPEYSGLPVCGLQWLANQRPRKANPRGKDSI